MANTDHPEVKFEGEEAGAGFASPTLDLIATAVLIAISIAMMVASYLLPMPGAIHTAPGLLPFIVSASLLLMALGLGASAVARRRVGHHLPAFSDRDQTTDFRSLMLAIAVAIYIAALQVFAFQQNFSLLGANLRLTAFASLGQLMALDHRGHRVGRAGDVDQDC